ncbi:MAG: hypothetical protein IJJ99_06750 [Oscillospiraceae bacterium]|nr:hypothetical protein [Oscillospiraceae bacterium]
MSAETEKKAEQQIEQKTGRRWLIYAVIGIAVALLLVLYLWTQTSSLDKLKRFVRYSGRHFASFSVSVPDAGACVIAGDRLCTASQDGVSAYAADGRLVFRVGAPYRDPAIKAAGDCILCYEIGGRQLSLLDTGGKERFSLHTDGRIYDAEVAQSGAVTVLTEGDGCRAVAEVYSKKGALLFRHESKSRYLNACALSPDGDYLAVNALGQEDIRFASAAMLFATDSEVMQAELSLDAQMIYDMAFLDDETLCAVGESSLQFFKADGTLLREYALQNGSLSAYRFADGIAAAAYDLLSGGSALVLLDAQGKELAYAEIDSPVLHLSICGSYLSVLTGRELRVYDCSLRLCGSTENQGWLAALVRSDGTAMCLTGSGAVLYIPG